VVGAAFLAAAVAAVAGWVRWRPRWRGVPRDRALAAGAAAAALAFAVVAIAGYAVQRSFNDRRYRGLEPPLAWVRAGTHHRVGLAGLWDVNGIYPVLPAFGPRLANQVAFVGPFERGMLTQFRSRTPFVDALRRGRYDLLVIGRAELAGTPRGEEAWARAAGYREVARSPRLVLLEAPSGGGAR
jgi:hypothetical protein